MKQWLLLCALFAGLSSQEPHGQHDNDERHPQSHRNRFYHYKYEVDEAAAQSVLIEYESVRDEVVSYQTAHPGQAVTTEVPILVGTSISQLATTLAPGMQLPPTPQFSDVPGAAAESAAAASVLPSPPSSQSAAATQAPSPAPTPDSVTSGSVRPSPSGASNTIPLTISADASAPAPSSPVCVTGIEGVPGCSLPSTSASSISGPLTTATSSGSDTTAASGNTTLAKPTVDPLAADATGKSSGGLSQQAKIGLGVGLGLGIPLLALIGAAAFFLARSRRKTSAQGPTDQSRGGSQVAYRKLMPSAGRKDSGGGMISGPYENEIKRGGSLSGAWEYQDEPTSVSAAGGAAATGAGAGAGAGAAGAGRYGRESSAMKSGIVSPITSTSRASRNMVTTLSTAATTPTQAQAPHDELSRPVSPVSPVSAISSISSLARRQSTAGRSARRPSI